MTDLGKGILLVKALGFLTLRMICSQRVSQIIEMSFTLPDNVTRLGKGEQT